MNGNELIGQEKIIPPPGFILDRPVAQSITPPKGLALDKPTTPIAPTQPAPEAPVQKTVTQALDKYGYYLGEPWNIPTGPYTGTWVYVGNNKWMPRQ